jgi:hypothetical protein
VRSSELRGAPHIEEERCGFGCDRRAARRANAVGSTIAWNLPLGGLWIGLPLGVPAIVLGVCARRAGFGVRMARAAIVLGGLAIAQMAVYTAVSSLP